MSHALPVPWLVLTGKPENANGDWKTNRRCRRPPASSGETRLRAPGRLLHPIAPALESISPLQTTKQLSYSRGLNCFYKKTTSFTTLAFKFHHEEVFQALSGPVWLVKLFIWNFLSTVNPLPRFHSKGPSEQGPSRLPRWLPWIKSVHYDSPEPGLPQTLNLHTTNPRRKTLRSPGLRLPDVISLLKGDLRVQPRRPIQRLDLLQLSAHKGYAA